jgi:hypothetical protein
MLKSRFNVLLDTGVAWTYQDFATPERNFNRLVLRIVGISKEFLRLYICTKHCPIKLLPCHVGALRDQPWVYVNLGVTGALSASGLDVTVCKYCAPCHN